MNPTHTNTFIVSSQLILRVDLGKRVNRSEEMVTNKEEEQKKTEQLGLE